jgi:hypothetical protein
LDEFALNIYGFADFTYTNVLNDFAYGSPYPTFLVGNINLYAGAELGGGWRSLVEFRLLYSPHGSVPPDQLFLPQPQRVNTTVQDPADYDRPNRWGGVEIERAWLEYTAHPLFTLRMGQWLTPYGIWNVDHGTPVVIGVRKPFVLGKELFPERQTGLEAYGSFLTGKTEIGYDIGLSNGRGPVDSYRDFDNNKAFTGRLFVTTETPAGTVTVGGTVYRGRYTDRYARFAFNPATGEGGNEYISTARYEEFSMAGDVRWIWDELTLQGELIMHDLAYDDALRPAILGPGPTSYYANHRDVGWYVMGAYRLPWFNIMPFFGGESDAAGEAFFPDGRAIWGGLNIRPVPRVVLKAQYTQSWFFDGTKVFGDDGIKAIDLQSAWSF